MAYTRKNNTPAPVKQELKTAEQVSKNFIETADLCEAIYQDENKRPGELQSAQEIVAGLHMIGVGLHEQLEELVEDNPSQLPVIRDGVLSIFRGISAGKLVLVEDKKKDDAYVVFDQGDRTTEMTVDESSKIIRRTAIGYGLVSGMSRAAAEAMREENAGD
jgi:hypothetical protein